MSSFASDLFLALLIIGSGIVVAGITSSIYNAITDDIPKFSMLEAEGFQLFCYVLLLIFCGPLVLIRNCYYGRILENRPMLLVFGGAMVAATWGLLTGLVIVNFIISAI